MGGGQKSPIRGKKRPPPEKGNLLSEGAWEGDGGESRGTGKEDGDSRQLNDSRSEHSQAGKRWKDG